MELSRADQGASPPRIVFPHRYNAAHDLIERNLRAGRSAKLAYVDDRSRASYAELAARVDRAGNALLSLGLVPEQRLLLALHDSIDFPAMFLGAIKAGIVPIAVNTLLTSRDYRYIIEDSRASALVVSAPLLPAFEQAFADGGPAALRTIVVSGEAKPPHRQLDELLAAARGSLQPAPTTGDDACFWLYSSGSTGAPKGTVHVHSSMIQTAELYARPVLGIGEDDVVFSAAKLFFAYGLGNALSFPLSVGATTVLMAERPTPAAVFQRLLEHRPTIFYGVPTLYAAMLASPEFPAREALRLRRCVSAGEPLPADIGRRFRERTGIDILDGIGSTEMLHIFLSNRADDVRYGTTGVPVPGYELRIVDEHGQDIVDGEQGELLIKGPTAAMTYWNNRPKSRATFLGDWTRSGDKYRRDEGGYYVYCGRNDDMLKVGGIWVSPVEVEAAIIGHPSVLEAAVVAWQDADGLVKPKAFVVLRPSHAASDALAGEIQEHVKGQLAHYKYPRHIEFVADLPKTATGKIQRFKLRSEA
ncbi:MAG TPA: benzoate-CoA ligase family protein [Casimicrobiaceae bacterium]|nr:benzoate-CoA ligase family protein [Casimicrobiaceae bacterium]